MRKFIFFPAILFFTFVSVLAYEEEPAYYEEDRLYTAGSVLVMCAETTDVLYENEGFTRRYPASITKIMTAIVVLEQVEDLSERIVFSERAVDLPHYAGSMEFEAGENMTVLEALYGIMLPSANDVARALAEHVSGSVGEFVILMNRRAEALGATETRFINPCGLPGNNQFTTAYDIALIKRAAIAHPLYVQIIRTPYFDFPPTIAHEYGRQVRNSNAMVRPSAEEFNPLVIGGKTGFTNAAQHTLVTYAAKDERELIISVLYASPRGAIFSDTAALIDYVLAEREEEPEEIIEDEIEEDAYAASVFEYEEDEPPEPNCMVKIAEILVFVHDEYEPPEPDEYAAPRVVSDTEAVVAASMSLAFTGLALLALAFIRKKLA